jgi:hypothetical protein
VTIISGQGLAEQWRAVWKVSRIVSTLFVFCPQGSAAERNAPARRSGFFQREEHDWMRDFRYSNVLKRDSGALVVPRAEHTSGASRTGSPRIHTQA